MVKVKVFASFCLVLLAAAFCSAKLNLLFLGDDGAHRPAERFELLEPVLGQRGITLTYTRDVADLNLQNFARYGALVLHANIDEIDPPHEKALLDVVAGGVGFVPLHCASFCFQSFAGAPFPVPKMTSLPEGPPPFDYVDVGAKIPNYVPSEKWGTQGDPHTRMQKPLPPGESIKRMVTPVGFHVELFAAEPDIGGKPLAMQWDERGRLWLCESVDYPNELRPRNQGRDRIRILEDTNSDGRADRFTVFADGLSIPTSIAFARGGAIVHNGTETLFLKDTDGDDRADDRRVLLATWAMGDTHGGPSNMQYGLDNWIWGVQGYNKSTIRIGEKTASFAQGFHRFRPDGSAIEFLRSTNNNTWGFGMSEEGVIFGSTANGNPSEYMSIPNRYYERVRGWTPQLTLSGIADSDRMSPITDKVRQVDHHGRHTAAAGHALYTARAYPKQYWNHTAFVCEPTGHLVGTWVLRTDGAGFRSINSFNLVASDDEWTAPTMAEIGPDGCVWVIDWYNYIVQHNPTPEGFTTGKGAAYESDLRDKTHGRIYRVVYGDMKPKKYPDLARASSAELVSTLANDNLLWRRHAQRLLVERGKRDCVPALIKLVEDGSIDEIGLNVGAIHALWTLHGLGAIEPGNRDVFTAAVSALRHPSAGVRRNAVQVLPPSTEATAAILEADLLNDSDAQARLPTLLALADQPPSRDVGRALAEFFTKDDHVNDRWLADAATSAAAMHAIDFLIAAAAKNSSPSHGHFEMLTTVANHFARGKPGEAVNELLVSLAGAEPSLAGAVIGGLAAGWQAGDSFRLGDPSLAAIEKLRTRLSLKDQIHLAQLAQRSGGLEMQPYPQHLAEALFKRIEDEKIEIAGRLEAAELLIALSPDDVRPAERLLSMVTPRTPPDLATGLIRALQECRAKKLGAVLVKQTADMSPSARDAAFDVMLARPTLTADLLNALESNAVRVNDLSLFHKQRLNEHPDELIRERARSALTKARENINQDRQQVLREFADVAHAPGDAARGKEVFTKNCSVCHRLRGEGASIGPDLSGMAVHGKEQILVHILDPNRDVEGNFVTYTAVTADGLVVSGMLAGESATSLELVDALGKRHAILRDDIEELTRTGASLMPAGFEKQLSREQLANVLAYLTDNAGFIPLDLSRVATVSSARGMFHTPESTDERLVFDDWGSKVVDGVPFYPIDPQDGRIRNVLMLHGPRGRTAPQMPRSVELKCDARLKALHFLSGVSGWGFPTTGERTVSMIVCFHYADGATEEHPLLNGVHFADYLGLTDVEGSKLAFPLGRQQVRYFKLQPKRRERIDTVSLIKGNDNTAPLVLAVTAEQL